MSSPLSLPSRSGAYRWLYLDVSEGEWSAVVIFMLGSVFSPRYARVARRGGSPLGHSAVNLALYRRGERQLWVLTEYPGATLDDGGTLRIGGSSLRYDERGHLLVHVKDRTAPWGRPAEALVELVPEVPRHPPVQLVEGQPHYWHPLGVRATATVRVPSHGLELRGRAYHDGNHGDEMLGAGLPGWRWTRLHGAESTRVVYEPPGVTAIDVEARTGRVEVARRPAPALAASRTGWGLCVPRELSPLSSETLSSPHLLESSPFYARLEARGPTVHALGEVADFRRFQRPQIRWMAHFRTRVERASVEGA